MVLGGWVLGRGGGREVGEGGQGGKEGGKETEGRMDGEVEAGWRVE